MTKRKIWTVEEQQYLRQIWAGYSLSELSYYLPFNPRGAQFPLKFQNYVIKQPSKQNFSLSKF
jgi:hypothetical protein